MAEAAPYGGHVADWQARFHATRAPSVAAKLRLVAHLPALAVLAEMQFSVAKSSSRLRTGGAYRDRTDDLMLAKQPLSQLS
jgi:hypothetical protein